MQESVKIDRDKWIGGSDIPAIMGLSRFRTRWDVLQEKAGIKFSEFEGNVYTDYGNVMEDKIRQYINKKYKRNFVEDVAYTDDCRFHLDGWDEEFEEVLEIKTTASVKKRLGDNKEYLSQLLPYMVRKGSVVGLLAVYERPKDFSEEFDPDRLTIFMVYCDVWKDFWDEIVFQLNLFRRDLARLRENPELTEEDLVPHEVITLTQTVEKVERQISYLKEMEKVSKEARRQLKLAMELNGIKSWRTNAGLKISYIEATDDTVVSELNVEKLREEQPDIYNKYLEDRLKAGKESYLRITAPKEW